MSDPSGYVQLQRSVKIDPDFIRLSPPGQWLYFQLLLDVNHIGVADWRPKKLMGRAETVNLEYVNIAALDLVENKFAVIDTMTEEVLIRTYMKHDGAHKQPNTCMSMLKAFSNVGSPEMRAVISHELNKIWHKIEGSIEAGNAGERKTVDAIRKRWNTLEPVLSHPAVTVDEALHALQTKKRTLTDDDLHAN